MVNVHQLRATYISLEVTAGLDPFTIKLLVNHLRTADVILGYVSPSLEQPPARPGAGHREDRQGGGCPPALLDE